MSVKINSTYIGDGQVETEHLSTGSRITTDLPVDNGGNGRKFSPTDLMASSLASCILTIMGEAAKREELDISGTSIEMEKIMADDPRRVGKLVMEISFPIHLEEFEKQKLMRFVKACPVHRSIHPDIEIEITKS